MTTNGTSLDKTSLKRDFLIKDIFLGRLLIEDNSKVFIATKLPYGRLQKKKKKSLGLL